MAEMRGDTFRNLKKRREWQFELWRLQEYQPLEFSYQDFAWG